MGFKWWYNAVALEIGTRRTIQEEGGRQCTGQRTASPPAAAKNGAICHWESNKWEISHTKVWRAEDWQCLLETGRSWPLKIGWVKGHMQDETPTTKASRLFARKKTGIAWSSGYTLSKATQAKQMFTMNADPEAGRYPWKHEATITTYPQCQIRLKASHPNQAPPQHIRQRKALWSTWQAGYIGPLKSSHGKRYILVRVEVVSGLWPQ